MGLQCPPASPPLILGALADMRACPGLGSLLLSSGPAGLGEALPSPLVIMQCPL